MEAHRDVPPAGESPLARFQAGCRAGRLLYQWDPVAGLPVFYPRVVCPGTGAKPQWRESAGAGTVYSTTTVRPRGGEPYDVSLVDLDEGFRMMSRVRADDVRIGMRVRVRFDDGLPVFVPA